MTEAVLDLSDEAKPRAPVAWAYLAASALGFLALFRFVSPHGGVVEHWPWQLPSPFEWSQEAATQLFFTLLAVVPLVAVFRPAGPVRGLVVATLIGLSLAALAALARGQGAESVFHYGVETYVPSLLAAFVAAGLHVSRATGRGLGLAAVAGAVLVVLLFYPSGPDVPRVRGVGAPYRAPVPSLVRDVVRRAGASDTERRAAVEAGAYTESASAVDVLVHPWSVVVLLSLLTGACGVAAAFAPRARRVLAWIALFTFLAIVAYPLAWLVGEVFTSPAEHEPARSRFDAILRAVGLEARFTYAPFVLALFAAAADLVRRPHPRNVG